ncbi:MAG: DNA alkylation repair protein [Eubacterium sp.]|nr:DNA alkylation repair protein [Eubacterium sp.]
MMNVREALFKNEDSEYKAFHSKLIPNVLPDKIIGVRVPVMRKIAKQAVRENADVQLDYYDEIMVKGFTVGYKKCDIEEHLADLKNFVPLIDNWAVCDCACSTFKFTEKNREEVGAFIQPYLDGSEYDIRFAVVMIMDYFLTDDYIEKSLEILTSIKSEFYYVNMAVAWAISVAYVKYEDKTLPIIENRLLPVWVHNKSIQKICESYRVDKQKKAYLKTLKLKNQE